MVTLSVKVEGNDLRLVTIEVEQAGALFDVPDLGCVVHRASRCQHAMRVETKADDLLLMTLERILHLSRV